MSTKATNITQQADGQGAVVSGKGASYVGAGGIGGDATFVTKAMDFTGASTGDITIGETGLGTTFAQTVEKLSAQNTQAISGLLAGLNQGGATEAATTQPQPPNWWLLGGLAFALALGAWLLRRK